MAIVKPNASEWKLEPGVIYCDTSIGSKEFLPIIQKRHGLKVALKKLNSADFAFRCGHTTPSPFCDGDHGCYIGIERKTLTDLVGSLLKGRLDRKQIPDMLVDYTLCWVLVEGEFRPALDDAIEQVVWRKQGNSPGIEIVKWAQARCSLTYSQLAKWLTRFDVTGKGRIKRWRVRDMNETAAFIASHYGWWRKEWKDHHLGSVDKIPPPMKALLFKPNEFQANMASMRGLGLKKMRMATNHFTSIIHAVNAPLREWQKTGIGKAAAIRVFAGFRREYR